MAKKVLLFLLIFSLVVAIGVALFLYDKVREKEYNLGDYGISIRLPGEFVKLDPNNDTHVLFMYGAKSKITVSATALPINYWSSGDLDVIMDEYVRLLSSAKYECNFKDVSLNSTKINDVEVGKVELTIEYRTQSYRTITYIFGEDSGNITLEFYGDPKNVNENLDLIEKITKTIKIGPNGHDYNEFKIMETVKSGE